MSSGKKFIGASAAFAAASEFLFRGYNIAFPEFDQGPADDLFVCSPESNKISRIQVRGKQTERGSCGNDGFSTPVITPGELTIDDHALDYAVMALRYDCQWLLGLFDSVFMKEIIQTGVGCHTAHAGRKTFDPRARVEKGTRKVFFSSIDVSRAFSNHASSTWNEFFPFRISDVKPSNPRKKTPPSQLRIVLQESLIN